MIALITAALGIIAATLTWYFGSERQRRKRELIRRIRRLEAEHDLALAAGNMLAVAQCLVELKRLRQEAGSRDSSK